MTRTLIRNGWVISMDPTIGEVLDCDVLIEDGRIAAVGPRLSSDGAEIIEARDRLVLPGLINAHLHLWQTGLRGLADNWVSAEYHENIHGNLAMRYTPEDSYLGTLVGALDQIDAGTTCVFDWCHNNSTPDHTDRSIDALMESGIRAVFGHGTVKPPQSPGIPHFSEVPHPRGEIERLRNGRLGSDDALVTLAMAILGPEFSTTDVLLQDFLLARELGLVSSSHDWNKVSRVSKERFFPVAREGLLGPSRNVVHGNFLGDDEIRLIVDCGASVTVTPTGEMQTSHGDPLTGRLLALGANPSLGAYTEVFVAGDMFHVMRFALQAQRALDHRAHAGRGEPLDRLTISPRQALEWATIEGARALMKEDRVGSLSPGKQADVILIQADDVGLAPINDPVQSIVLYAGPANVDTVLIVGQAVKRDGRLVYPREERLRRQEWLAASVERVFRDGGYVHQVA